MMEEGLATRAAVVLDPRLAEIWQLIWSGAPDGEEHPGVSEEIMAGLLRLAYLQGFADAKDEPVDGALYRELGIRRATARTAARLPDDRSPRRSSGR